jgi:hypothetical protein
MWKLHNHLSKPRPNQVCPKASAQHAMIFGLSKHHANAIMSACFSSVNTKFNRRPSFHSRTTSREPEMSKVDAVALWVKMTSSASHEPPFFVSCLVSKCANYVIMVSRLSRSYQTLHIYSTSPRQRLCGKNDTYWTSTGSRISKTDEMNSSMRSSLPLSSPHLKPPRQALVLVRNYTTRARGFKRTGSLSRWLWDQNLLNDMRMSFPPSLALKYERVWPGIHALDSASKLYIQSASLLHASPCRKTRIVWKHEIWDPQERKPS